MKETLPGQILNEKLPRFLQKCVQSFESDRRYRNDLRFLRVWLQLMDFVDDPKTLLRTMEAKRIGTRRSLFYQAYALYYEKMKKFDEAEKMYHLGVQNLAEPLDNLQKAYEQFLHRMERHKKKILCYERRTAKRPLGLRVEMENCETICKLEDRPRRIMNEGCIHETVAYDENSRPVGTSNHNRILGNSRTSTENKQVIPERKLNEPKILCSDDTVVVKFVDNAVIGKSEAEDACHHGLLDPTINMKEAMNDINNMFREPIEAAPVRRRSQRSKTEEDHVEENGFKIFVDENVDSRIELLAQKEKENWGRTQISHPNQEPFQIFIDDEENNENVEANEKQCKTVKVEVQNFPEDSVPSASHPNAFVFLCPKDNSSESSDDLDSEASVRLRFREDTVVHRFVGSTILDAPEVENVCHHGLVDPTINLKEAMDDINNMFGKPIDFARAKRPKKQEKAPVREEDFGRFSILPDDDMEYQQCQPVQPTAKASNNLKEHDLFEPTIFTKEALDDINKMFGMPLDF